MKPVDEHKFKNYKRIGEWEKHPANAGIVVERILESKSIYTENIIIIENNS